MRLPQRSTRIDELRAGLDPPRSRSCRICLHANPMTTLQIYAHGRSQDRSDAQDEMLAVFFLAANEAVYGCGAVV